MEKIVYHKMPKKISPKGLKQLENLKRMNDDNIGLVQKPGWFLHKSCEIPV
jgi:hypothetical protein